ncbi:APOBEC1 complementation factor [Halotydeus destructor]|nr:APOBEC1 complementation factor [Halotydeus destructor]
MNTSQLSTGSPTREGQGDGGIVTVAEITRKAKPSRFELSEVSRVIDNMLFSMTHAGDDLDFENDYICDEKLKNTLTILTQLIGETESLEPEKPVVDFEQLNSVPLVPRLGYQFNTFPRQRVYGAIETRADIVASDSGCHMVIKHIPQNFLEPQLLDLLDPFGRIYELRIPIDFETGMTKGQAYVTFYFACQLARALKKLNGLEIEPGHFLIAKQITPKTRLFIGNLPKCKRFEDLEKSFGVLTHGLNQVISFSAERRGQNNRGFCFLEYNTHESAVAARKRLTSMKIFGCDLQVDWAWERAL